MKNEFAVSGDTVYIFLPRRNDLPLLCRISLVDFEKAASIHGGWGAYQVYGGRHYARTTTRVEGKNRFLQMHRWLFGLTARNMIPDHVDHDGLNNTRSNILIGTHAQNILNQQRVHGNLSGVFKDGRRWYGRIKINYKTHRFGSFASAQEASEAVENARKEARLSMNCAGEFEPELEMERR